MIVVDELRTYTGIGRLNGQWCHMTSDTDDLDELHAFAAKLGLKRSWFQNHRLAPHYDLRPSKRVLAVKLGAKELNWREMGNLIRQRGERLTALLPSPDKGG